MIPRIDIAGVSVSAANMDTALLSIDERVQQRKGGYVCVTGVHGIVESYRNQAIRQIHNTASLVVPDGMPLVWLCRAKGIRQVGRVYGPDLMLGLCQRSLDRGYRHFLYGGKPEVLEQLAIRLRARFPALNIVGSYSPPFRPLTAREDEKISAAIKHSRPDIVWVGISTPKQELWMARHHELLRPAVLLGVGAAFDFHAGVKRQAPRWMMRTGLEWLFRMLQEPRRLGPRYLRNNPVFAALILLQVLGFRTQPIRGEH